MKNYRGVSACTEDSLKEFIIAYDSRKTGYDDKFYILAVRQKL